MRYYWENVILSFLFHLLLLLLLVRNGGGEGVMGSWVYVSKDWLGTYNHT